MVDFNAQTQGSKGSLTIFYSNGESKTLASNHPTYAEVLTYLVATPPVEHDEDHIRDLANPALRIGKMLRDIDPLFGFDQFRLSYEGLPVSGALADLITARLNAREGDWERFARFLASLERNPSATAKRGLFDWVTRTGLHILEDGRFVAHKGVRSDGSSVSSGPNNFIDGVLYGKPGESVHVPHYIGSVVSKRRGDVDDSRVACSTGLHVGTLEYASKFGGSGNRLLTVAVAAEDVVGGDESYKIRVCRYEVLSLNESRSEFQGGNYVTEDRSGEVSAFEIQSSKDNPVKSKTHEWTDEERAEYNGLVSYGRRLYDNLRTQFGKTHAAAYAAALAEFGTFEEFQAKRAEEAAAAAQAEAEATSVRLAQEAADAEAQRVQEAEEVLSAARTEALNDSDEQAEAPAPGTLAALAAENEDLRKDLADTSLGHKPLARKWANLTTESSVRRYRKANDIQVSTWTKVKDALS